MFIVEDNEVSPHDDPSFQELIKLQEKRERKKEREKKRRRKEKEREKRRKEKVPKRTGRPCNPVPGFINVRKGTHSYLQCENKQCNWLYDRRFFNPNHQCIV